MWNSGTQAEDSEPKSDVRYPKSDVRGSQFAIHNSQLIELRHDEQRGLMRGGRRSGAHAVTKILGRTPRPGEAGSGSIAGYAGRPGRGSRPASAAWEVAKLSDGRMRIRDREPATPRPTGSLRSKMWVSLPFIQVPAPVNEVVILRPEGSKSQGVQGGNVTGATFLNCGLRIANWGSGARCSGLGANTIANCRLRIADCGLEPRSVLVPFVPLW